VEAGGRDDELVGGCCDFLASVADERGAVPFVLPSYEGYPHAAHWDNGRWKPEVHPTVWNVWLLRALGVEHDWLDRATAYCLDELARELPSDAHALREVLRFADIVGDDALWERTAAAVPQASWLRLDAESAEYGLTPLQLAQSAERARTLFAQDVLDAHLDALEAGQSEDGGWPISWDPPGDASRLEWRGRWTVQALVTLRDFGRPAR
jgi:hypothetical protein